MGMYTELIFGARLKKSIRPEIVSTLTKMIEGGYKHKDDEILPLGRNPLSGGSYYFGVCQSVSKMWKDEITQQYIVSTRANIKNYNSDIEKFLEWIKPFIDSGSGDREMYAIVIYEQSEPVLFFLEDE